MNESKIVLNCSKFYSHTLGFYAMPSICLDMTKYYRYRRDNDKSSRPNQFLGSTYLTGSAANFRFYKISLTCFEHCFLNDLFNLLNYNYIASMWNGWRKWDFVFFPRWKWVMISKYCRWNQNFGTIHAKITCQKVHSILYM